MESENERIKQSAKNLAFVNEKVIEENTKLKDRIAELEKEKTEQLKHFGEMLKEKGKSTYDFFQCPTKENKVISIGDIDETLKEFINNK